MWMEFARLIATNLFDILKEHGAALVCMARDDKDIEKNNMVAKEHRLPAENLHIHISKRLGETAASVINTGNADVNSHLPIFKVNHSPGYRR